LKQNQCMPCIVCHNETVGLEILTLCIRCCKCFVAYNKAHGTSTMMRHVEQKHASLLKRFKEVLHTCPQTILNQEQKTK
jgi:hypothetical protein